MSKPQTEHGIPAQMRPKYDQVVGLIDAFCREYLNEEYRVLCRRLAGMLARKRPSPMVNGTPAAWACGVVRAVGFVNFVDDRTQNPHMTMGEIDQAFGVSTATGQGRSKAIRDLFKMWRLDPEWTLPSRMDDNLMAWMIEVNGLIVDARWLPREIQEEAFHRGLIPYLPEPQGDSSPAAHDQGGAG
jgi:hypothetical protein